MKTMKVTKSFLEKFMDYCFSGTVNSESYPSQSAGNIDGHPTTMITLHIMENDGESSKEIYTIKSSEVKYREDSDRSLSLQMAKIRREIINSLIYKYIEDLFNKGRERPALLDNLNFFSYQSNLMFDVINNQVMSLCSIIMNKELFHEKPFRKREALRLIELIRDAFEKFSSDHPGKITDDSVQRVKSYVETRLRYIEFHTVRKTQTTEDLKSSLRAHSAAVEFKYQKIMESSEENTDPHFSLISIDERELPDSKIPDHLSNFRNEKTNTTNQRKEVSFVGRLVETLMGTGGRNAKIS